jgi:hypothetical protein
MLMFPVVVAGSLIEKALAPGMLGGSVLVSLGCPLESVATNAEALVLASAVSWKWIAISTTRSVAVRSCQVFIQPAKPDSAEY